MVSMHNHEQKPQDEERYWQRNQLIITFVTSLDSREPANSKENIIDQLPFEQINDLLARPRKDGHKTLGLRNFGPDDIPRRKGEPSLSISSVGNFKDPAGKHLFPLEDGQDGRKSVITAAFHIDDVSPDKGEGPEPDNTIEAIERINEGRSECMTDKVLSLNAAPNWYVSSTGDVTHGCPVSPPLPFDGSTVCQSDPGYYPITVPQLTSDLQSKDGEGVTVFVLDAFPKKEVIYQALERVRSGGNNLLVDVAEGMVELEAPFTCTSMATDMAKTPAINYCYQDLPDDDFDNKDQPKTGKDIDGFLIGYPMADHGLFVTGIIRSLARQATIVCIRVLNDFGVSDVATLNDTLEGIVKYVQQEKERSGQNYCPRFVMNLSAVSTPYNEQFQCYKLSKAMEASSRDSMREALGSLAQFGVVLVAAAGNDSDMRQPMHCMHHMDGMHLDARYPAAFADTLPQVIPVGSVDKNGRAAKYSNCPGNFGVATYGGGILERDTPHPVTQLTRAKLPPDAFIGLYTSRLYPVLSKDDNSIVGRTGRHAVVEASIENKAWAYWSGTSFSTPIITALVARILQSSTDPGANVRQMVIDLASHKVEWPGHHAEAPLIQAKQCVN